VTTGFVQLYQTSFATVDANGDVSFEIVGPQVTRTWLGSLTFVGLPGGTLISVSVGAQAYGQMSAPGPGGLFELLHGISLVATATGLTPGLQVSMILAGADFPAAQAPPYFGPSLITATATAGSGGFGMANTNTPHNFSVKGALVVPASASDDIPGFQVSTPVGAASFLTRVSGFILSGTSYTFTVFVNGTPVTAWTGLEFTTTPSGLALLTPLAVADLDYVNITATAVDGSPIGLVCLVDEVVVYPT
jgi:hypothetical protein